MNKNKKTFYLFEENKQIKNNDENNLKNTPNYYNMIKRQNIFHVN